MEQYQKKVQLDTRGLFCPEPVFRTKTAMDKLAIGEVLELWADDPAAEEDISRWAKRTGNEVLSIRKESRDLIFLIKRK